LQDTHNDTTKQIHCDSYVYIHSPHKDNIKGEAELRGTDPKRLENAIAERVNGILKEELLQHKYPDIKTARIEVAKAIVIYNTLRPHSSCNMLTPHIAHIQSGKLKKHWKNYYLKKEVTMAAP